MNQIWKKPLWPSFNWNPAQISPLMAEARFTQGKLMALSSDFIHSYEVIKTKKPILEEILNPALSINKSLLDGWHGALFPTGYAGTKRISVAELRKQDLSERLLPSSALGFEFSLFLNWQSESPKDLDPIIKSGLSFLWFYILSPYMAGNFDLASALAEKVLQQGEKTKTRSYDLSLNLEDRQSEVEDLINTLVLKDMDITIWLEFYLTVFTEAATSALSIADHHIKLAFIWQKLSVFNLNLRQKKLIHYLLENESNLTITNRFYVELCGTSRESAKRDLTKLKNLKILTSSDAAGRSASYLLNTIYSFQT